MDIDYQSSKVGRRGMPVWTQVVIWVAVILFLIFLVGVWMPFGWFTDVVANRLHINLF